MNTWLFAALSGITLAVLLAIPASWQSSGLGSPAPSSDSVPRIPSVPGQHVLLQLGTGRLHTSASSKLAEQVVAQSSVDKQLAESHQLSTTLEKLTTSANVAPLQKELFQHFRQCATCSQFQRLGEDSDGGYLTCMAASKPQGLFSVGVEKHDRWSEDASKLFQVPVSQFDCTVDSAPAGCADCKFYKKCFRSAETGGDDPNSWTLKEAVEQTGHGASPKGSLLMKIDIEGSEWKLFAGTDASTLQKFGQIIAEYHSVSKEADHELYVKSLNRLKEAGFRVVHIHGNNYEGMYEVDGLSVPNVIEVTYMLMDESTSPTCLPEQQHDILDHPNNLGANELPMAHLEAAK